MFKHVLRGSSAAIIIAVVAVLVIAAGVTAALLRPTMEQPSPSPMAPSDAAMQEDTQGTNMDGETMIKNEEIMMDDGNDAMKPTDQDPMIQGNEQAPDVMMTQKGSYEAYAPNKLALAANGDVVLFFRASWCPTCRALDADIKANLSAIPDGVTILDVNYDTETALKQKYGVTYQHTLVQVDAQGNLIKKWTNSSTLASFVAQIQ